MSRTLTEASVTIPAPAKLLTENAQRRLHWSRRAEIIRQWRSAGKVYARVTRVPRFAWVEVEVHVTQARGVLADAGAGSIYLTHHGQLVDKLDGWGGYTCSATRAAT